MSTIAAGNQMVTSDGLPEKSPQTPRLFAKGPRGCLWWSCRYHHWWHLDFSHRKTLRNRHSGPDQWWTRTSVQMHCQACIEPCSRSCRSSWMDGPAPAFRWVKWSLSGGSSMVINGHHLFQAAVVCSSTAIQARRTMADRLNWRAQPRWKKRGGTAVGDWTVNCSHSHVVTLPLLHHLSICHVPSEHNLNAVTYMETQDGEISVSPVCVWVLSHR